MLLIPWYRSIFSSDTIFILPEELPLTFLIMQFSWWFSFNLKNSIFSLLFWKDFFTSYRIIVWWLSFPFFLSALQRCLFSYGLQIFWWEAGCHFICFYVVCLSDFIIFISAILLWGLYVRVFNVLLGVLWFPWICMVIIFIQLGKILLDIFSVPFFPPLFFFSLGLQLTPILDYLTVSTGQWIGFSLYVLVCMVFIAVSWLTDQLHRSVYLLTPAQYIFHFR